MLFASNVTATPNPVVPSGAVVTYPTRTVVPPTAMTVPGGTFRVGGQ